MRETTLWCGTRGLNTATSSRKRTNETMPRLTMHRKQPQMKKWSKTQMTVVQAHLHLQVAVRHPLLVHPLQVPQAREALAQTEVEDPPVVNSQTVTRHHLHLHSPMRREKTVEAKCRNKRHRKLLRKVLILTWKDREMPRWHREKQMETEKHKTKMT